jgi:exodeoxyribonuclease-1
LSVLQLTDTSRIMLDTERNLRHLEQLRTASGIAEKVRQVFARETKPVAAADTDIALYDCFFSDDDRPLLRTVRDTPPEQLGKHAFGFKDQRCAELLFRYRARNWPHTLDVDETQRWEIERRRRLETATPSTPRTLEEYFSEIAALRADESTTPAQFAVLDQLEQWGRKIL